MHRCCRDPRSPGKTEARYRAQPLIRPSATFSHKGRRQIRRQAPVSLHFIILCYLHSPLRRPTLHRLNLVLERVEEARAVLFAEFGVVGLSARRLAQMAMEIAHAE